MEQHGEVWMFLSDSLPLDRCLNEMDLAAQPYDIDTDVTTCNALETEPKYSKMVCCFIDLRHHSFCAR